MDALSRRDVARPSAGRRPSPTSPTSGARATGFSAETGQDSHHGSSRGHHNVTSSKHQSAANPPSVDMTHQALTRRRSTAQTLVDDLTSLDRRRRRSSTFSAYSFTEAKQDLEEEIIDPGSVVSTERQDASWKSRLPIMFAVVPPVAGVIFQGGAAFFGDLLLLGLAAIFLHWSVTAPW